MTEAGRAQQIVTALADYEQQGGPKETLLVPLRTGNRPLPVITVPLDLPVLNTRSFRIAPLLASLAEAEQVAADPFSASSQRIVSELVVTSHRHADDLKESLKHDGQDTPGVITREGVLINANTRCVLMRELLREGDLRSDGLRVAVLPPGTTNAELYDLEAVLQKRKEHKDDYNLVSELLMLKVLNVEAGMTDKEIARRQNLRKPEDVRLRLRVLDLMERARRLADPALPIKTFARERDKLQNWKELLLRVDELEARSGAVAGDDHIKEWLVPYLLGLDSVHVLRGATEGWLERHGVDALSDGGAVSINLARSSAATTEDDADDSPEPEGLGLLDLGEPGTTPEPLSRAAGNLFDVTVAALSTSAEDEVELPDGTSAPAGEVRDALTAGLKRGLAVSRARLRAGGRLEAPERFLKSARDQLEAAVKALEEVVDDELFASRADGCRTSLEDLSQLLDEATEILNDRDELDTEDD